MIRPPLVVGLILFGGYFAAGCSTTPSSSCGESRYSSDDLILQAPSEVFRARASLSSCEAQNDARYLKYAFESAYGARQEIDPGKLSAAWETILEKARSVPNIRSRDFCDVLADSLAFISDGHLTFVSGEEACGHRAKREGHVGRNTGKGSQLPWHLEKRVSSGTEFTILAITHFPSPEDSEWKGFTEAVTRIREHKGGLVIDLRGNGGGYDQKAKEAAAILFGAAVHRRDGTVRASQTPDTAALRVNLDQMSIARSLSKRAEIPGYLTAQLAKDESTYEKLKRESSTGFHEFARPNGPPLLRPAAFGGPTYILVDGACISSCESALEYFHSIPGAKSVGERTGGLIQTGNVGLLHLPTSGINVFMTTYFIHFDDGSVFEKVGYSPDIEVAPGKDALDAVLGSP